MDIWSAGIIFLSLLTKKNLISYLPSTPYVVKSFKMQCLLPIVFLFGSEEVKKACYHLGIAFRPPSIIEKLNLSSIISSSMDDSNPLDLLKKLLELEPQNRIAASEALNHGFFDEIRAEFAH